MPNRLSHVSCKIAEFIYGGAFEAILVTGGSNQLSRSLLTFGWRKLYENVRMPKIFIFPREVNHLIYKSDKSKEVCHVCVRDWIAKNMQDLNSYKGRRVCVVDDYAMIGVKCTELSRLFSDLGFKQVQFALFAASRYADLPSESFVALRSSSMTRELCELSLLIQGEPSHNDSLQQLESTPQERRTRALNILRSLKNGLGNS